MSNRTFFIGAITAGLVMGVLMSFLYPDESAISTLPFWRAVLCFIGSFFVPWYLYYRLSNRKKVEHK